MNWEDAKKRLDNSEFPKEVEGFKEVNMGEVHYPKKAVHYLLTYKKYIDPIGYYEIEAKYNFCKNCGEVRNKVLVMYNNEEGTCFEKWFKYHGKEVPFGKDPVLEQF